MAAEALSEMRRAMEEQSLRHERQRIEQFRQRTWDDVQRKEQRAAAVKTDVWQRSGWVGGAGQERGANRSSRPHRA